ncbi:MAG TPA: YceH family protein [Casimicrobiaceae bacterium]
MTVPVLSPVEARVLGVLVEKQRTVPDTYPLTLNALLAGCNQKTSREPILSLPDADVQQAIDELRGRSMLMETSGGRVMRYAHNLERVLALPAQSVALLAALLLRGPQTAGELRINTERMHRFADISAVEAFLDELAARASGALVAELARVPGARETRWMHLLSGPAPAAATRGEARGSGVPTATPPASDAATGVEEVARLREEVLALREEVAALRVAVDRLRGAGTESAADGPDR